jgi:hypothetical protein
MSPVEWGMGALGGGDIEEGRDRGQKGGSRGRAAYRMEKNRGETVMAEVKDGDGRGNDSRRGAVRGREGRGEGETERRKNREINWRRDRTGRREREDLCNTLGNKRARCNCAELLTYRADNPMGAYCSPHVAVR